MENRVKELNMNELEIVNGSGFSDIVGGLFGGGLTGGPVV